MPADALALGALAAARSRWQAMAAKDPAHGQVGAAVAQRAELALDPGDTPSPYMA